MLVQGYFVLAGACVRSIPQIIRIQRSRRQDPIKCLLCCSLQACSGHVSACEADCSNLIGLLCSAEGLSEAANLSELIAYSIMIAYNFRLGKHLAPAPRTRQICTAENAGKRQVAAQVQGCTVGCPVSWQT